jgi:hypothetical protein
MPPLATTRIEINIKANVRWCFDLAELRKGIGVNCSGEHNIAFSAAPRKFMMDYLEGRKYARWTMTSIMKENCLVETQGKEKEAYYAAPCALFRGKYDSPKPDYIPNDLPFDPLHMGGSNTKKLGYANIAGMGKDNREKARQSITGCAGGDTYKDYNFADWKEVIVCHELTLLPWTDRGKPEWELAFFLQVEYLQLESFDEDTKKIPGTYANERMHITCFVMCRTIVDMMSRNVILDDEFDNLYFEFIDMHAAHYYGRGCFRDHTSERGEGEWARLRKVIKLFSSRKNRLTAYWEQDIREALTDLAMDGWTRQTSSRAETHSSFMRKLNEESPVTNHDLFIPSFIAEFDEATNSWDGKYADEVRAFLAATPCVDGLTKQVTSNGLAFKVRDADDWQPVLCPKLSGPIPSMQCEIISNTTTFSAVEKGCNTQTQGFCKTQGE